MITNLVNSIVNAFNGVLTGFGSGVADFFETLFLSGENGQISTFAQVSLAMMGVGIAIGIARWIIHKVG